jgi:tetratricopeptide (TPR) repeat protein
MTNPVLRLLQLLVFIVTSNVIGYGCINSIGSSTVTSVAISVGDSAPEEFHEALTTHPGKAHWLKVLADLQIEKARSSRPDPVETQINAAVAMLHLGMIKQAITILEKFERTYPDNYYAAANLGTAYELNGENAKALEWIRKGIERNPDAHNGSEWLHVKILEAKLALEKDPKWLTTNSVIGLHSLSDQQLSGNSVVIGNPGKPLDLQGVEEAIIYQLHERLEFIRPPEGVVANLLFDLGRILDRSSRPNHAAIIHRLAQTYGPDLMPWRSAPVLPAVEIPTTAATTTPYWLAGSVIVAAVLCAGIFVLMRRKRRNQNMLVRTHSDPG